MAQHENNLNVELLKRFRNKTGYLQLFPFVEKNKLTNFAVSSIARANPIRRKILSKIFIFFIFNRFFFRGFHN